MASADHTRDPWYARLFVSVLKTMTHQPVFCVQAHGSSFRTLVAHSRWAQSVAQYGTASRVLGTRHEYVSICLKYHLELKTCVGRPLRRCHVCYQSPRASNRGQLRRVGRHVLDIRLCGEGRAPKGGHVERDHLRVHDWWMPRCAQ